MDATATGESEPSKGRRIGYWVVTALLALGLTAGGAADLMGAPAVMESLAALGYPAYLATILGVCKLLAVIAVLAPRFPLVKEWAYAGIVFDLLGAIVSHAAVGDPVGTILTPAPLLLLAVASWALRPPSRRVAR